MRLDSYEFRVRIMRLAFSLDYFSFVLLRAIDS